MWELSLLVADAADFVERHASRVSRWRLVIPLAVLAFGFTTTTDQLSDVVLFASMVAPVAVIFALGLRRGPFIFLSHIEFRYLSRLSLPAFAALFGVLIGTDWGFSAPNRSVLENGIVMLPPD
jgi:hypothetical protein